MEYCILISHTNSILFKRSILKNISYIVNFIFTSIVFIVVFINVVNLHFNHFKNVTY